MRVLRRLAAPHLLLAAYCLGLVLALEVRPPLWLLVAAAAGGVLLGVALRQGGLWPAGGRQRGSTAGGMATGLEEGEEVDAGGHAQPQAEGNVERSGAALRAWRPSPLALGLAVALLATGLAVGGARLVSLEVSGLAAHAGERLPLAAVVTDLPAIEEDQVSLTLRVTQAGGQAVNEPAHLRLALRDGQQFALDPCGPLGEGALIELASVRVKPLPEARPGQFDYARYLRRRGEHVLLEAEFADLKVIGRRGGVRGGVDALRRASRAHLLAGLKPPVRDVLQGMVLGDDEGVDEQLIEQFRRSGLLHIMAVSGENVVLLCSMWTFAFMLLAIPRLARTALLIPIVATYVVLTGASPSIVRAGVAGIIALLAIMASRPSDGWLLWLAPAAWLLTANPCSLFDVSFQLSFGAVAGLLLLARPLTRLLAFLPGPLAEQIGVTMAASLSTAPVSMLTFGSTSLVSVPANVAGGFVLGPIMFLGMLSLLFGFVSTWLSVPLNLLAGLFIGFLLTVARLFSGISWAVYEWRGPTLGVVLAAVGVLLLGAVWVLARRAGQTPWSYVRTPGRLAPLLSVCAVVVAVALLAAPPGPAAPAQLTLTFLDVGEGAASLLQVPSGPTVLVDAGPAPLARTLREHGVKAIDLLVLSHGHADHVAGLGDVVGAVPIAAALLPQPPAPSPALDRLARELAAAGAEVRRCVTAQQLAGEGWGLQVLPTAAQGGTDANQGENDNALVVLAELAGRKVLLPGDAEGDVLARLNLPPCAVVGVPHHGSRGGLSAALLSALAPQLAVIPVGPNKFGHPTAETLTVLARAGVPAVRTDQRGDVVLTTGEDGLAVTSEREEKVAQSGRSI